MGVAPELRIPMVVGAMRRAGVARWAHSKADYDTFMRARPVSVIRHMPTT